MAYTDQQRAAFQDAYTKRRRQRRLMLLLVFAVMAPLPFIEDGDSFFGLPGAVLGPICLLAIVIGWVIVDGRIWRCPACAKYLGRAFNPRHCRSCRIELRRS